VLHEGSCGLNRAVFVREDVDVAGGSGDDAVRDESMPAGQGESVSAGSGEGDSGDFDLERVR